MDIIFHSASWFRFPAKKSDQHKCWLRFLLSNRQPLSLCLNLFSNSLFFPSLLHRRIHEIRFDMLIVSPGLLRWPHLIKYKEGLPVSLQNRFMFSCHIFKRRSEDYHSSLFSKTWNNSVQLPPFSLY